jgi:hypothetical protein
MLLNIRQHHETPVVRSACISAPLSTPGLAVRLLTIRGQMASATENALINTLETRLAVARVWVFFAEVPTI